MGLQINSQPQSFQSSVVIGNGLSAVNGLTVHGSVTATNSISSPSVSAGFLYGDGSQLTNINAGNIQGFSGVTSINGLTGSVSNVAFTVSANNFTQGLTGTTGTFTTSISSTSVDGGSILSGGQNLNVLFGNKTSTDSVFTTVNSNSSTWGQGYSSVSSNSANWGLATTKVNSSSSNWDQTYTDVNGNSGNWGQAYTGLTSTSGNWNAATTKVNSSSAGWDQVTSKVNSASSNWDQTYSGVNANSGNWNTSWSRASSGVTNSVNGLTGAVTGVIVASGGTIDSGDLTISNNKFLITDYIKSTGSSTPLRLDANVLLNGSLTALSGATFVNTTFATTSALTVSATLNAGPAFEVRANGTGDIASFYDSDQGVEVLHIGGINSTASPNVGIKTSFPNKTFTVSGEISASGDAWFGSNIYANNSNINTLYAAKGVTDQVTTAVNTNSANWGLTTTKVNASSSNWDQTYTAVTVNSGNWTQGYTTLTTNSANWGLATTKVNSSSSNWDQTYTAVNSNSGNWGQAYTGLTSTSGNWNQTYTAVNSNSAKWNQDNAVVVAGSGYWNTAWSQISSGQLSAAGVGFTVQTSLSSPAISAGKYYGDGSALSGVATSVTGVLFTSGGTITGANGFLNVPILSAQSVSATNYQILPSTLNNQTATYTLQTSDNGKIITLSSSNATNVTIPTGLPVGFSCMVLRLGSGTVSFSAENLGTTTLNSLSGYTTIADQYGGVSVLCYASEKLILNGSLGYP